MSEQMKILQMIESGQISPDEGAKRLQELSLHPNLEQNQFDSTLDILTKIENGEITPDEGISKIAGSSKQNSESIEQEETIEIHQVPPNIPESELKKWKRWWTYPLYAGVAILILSAIWMNSAFQNHGFGIGFFLSWIPISFGLLLMTLSWNSRTGLWIHVRVKGKSENVAISLPAPLGLTTWALRNFGHYIPKLEKTYIDEILLALENTSKTNTPLYVHVDEGEDGEQVEVFIG